MTKIHEPSELFPREVLKNLTIGEAYTYFPNAQNPEAACYGRETSKAFTAATKLLSTRPDIEAKTDHNPHLPEMIAAAHITEMIEIGKLPRKMQIDLADSLGSSDKADAQRLRLHEHLKLIDPAFAVIDQKSKLRFIEKVNEAGTLNIFTKLDFSREDVLRAANEMSALHAEAYGYKSVSVEAFNTPPQRDKDGTLRKTIARFNRVDKLIELNANEEGNFNSSFDSIDYFVFFMDEELSHAYANHIVERLQTVKNIEQTILEENGITDIANLDIDSFSAFDDLVKLRLDRDYPDIANDTLTENVLRTGSLRSQAEVFEYGMSADGYIDNDNSDTYTFEDYQNSPMEFYAKINAQLTTMLLATDEMTRNAVISGFEKGIELAHAEDTASENYKEHALRNPDDLCYPWVLQQ